MSDSGFTPLGIDHVVLTVRDQTVSQRFWTETLGCTLEFVNREVSLVQLRFGEALIDLLPARDGATPGARGVDHVCLSIRCDDAAALATRLRAQGVTVEGDVVARRGAFGVGPSLYIRDPDGYLVELKPR